MLRHWVSGVVEELPEIDDEACYMFLSAPYFTSMINEVQRTQGQNGWKYSQVIYGIRL
ncbi:hypothetical protein ACH8E3_02250 [Paenibacillus sp. CMAA1364]